MDDLIGRQAAIDALKEVSEHYTDKGREWHPHVDFMVQAIEELPSAEPRWIPCSEKLPEHGVSVLLSHVGYVSEDYLDIDDGAMYFWNSGIDLDEELNNLAWMPLPEPWKGESDG